MSMFTTLAAAWMDAKSREVKAIADRHEIEKQILESGGLPDLPEEGERSKREAHFLATVQNALYVSLASRPEFEEAVAEGKIPQAVVRPDLYETGVKRLRRAAMEQDDQALLQYSGILPYLRITPAKPSFKIVLTAQ